MKSKLLLASIAVVILLLACGATVVILTVARGIPAGSQVRFGQVDRFSAEGSQDWSFAADGAVELSVDSSFGDLKVTGGSGDTITVTAHKTAWDSSQERADAALKEMPIVVRQEGSKIIVTYQPPAQVLVVGEMRADTVDFTITVPQDCAVKAVLNSGDISLAGIAGKTDLESQFGDILVEDVQGELRAMTNSGEVTAARVQAGQSPIHLESQFGDLRLEQATAGAVTVEVNSGKINLMSVDASGEVSLDSQFGDIEFSEGRAAALDVQSNSGRLTLGGLTVTGALTADSQFGDIEIEKVVAERYTLTANSGDITLQGAQGAIKAFTQFGRIDIREAKDAQLDLEANSGGIDFSGSLGSGPHKIKSQFGDVRIVLPKDTALNFDLKTEFGKLKSAFQLTMSGDIDEKHWVGMINGGGASLTVEVNSGNITLEMLSQ